MKNGFSQFFEAVANRLLGPSSLRDVTYGVLIFFILKVLLISAGIATHKTPRMGDDSFVYLWFAKSNLTNELYNSRGVRSLERQASELAQPKHSPDQIYLRNKAAWRVTGHSPSFATNLFAKLENTKLGFYQMFWIQEFVGIIFLALALWFLFSIPSRPRGLLLIIPMMALARFPGQGIHFLVPSVFALAFGMLTWGLVGQNRRRPVAVYMATSAALFSHLIGLAHGGIAGLIVIFRWFAKQITLRRAMLEAGALLLALAGFIWFKFSGIAQPKIGPSSFAVGLDGVFANFIGTVLLIWKFARHDLAVTFLVILGAVYVFAKLERSNFYWMIVGVLLIAVASSLTITTIGLPGEVARRFLVPAFIVFMAFAGNAWLAALEKLNDRRGDTYFNKSKVLSGFVFCVLAVASLTAITVHSQKNLANRWAQLDRFAIAESLKKMPPDAHILYGETDMAMMASFLAGGYKFQSSAWPFLETQPEAGQKWYRENRPSHLVFLMPRELQPDSEFRSGFTEKRDDGYRIDDTRTLEFTLPAGISKVFFKLTETPRDLTFRGNINCIYSVTADKAKDWFFINTKQCQSADRQGRAKIVVTGSGFIGGVRYGPNVQIIDWPWGSKTELKLVQKKWFGLSNKRLNYSFEWQKVFERSGLKNLYELVDGSHELISDQNGLLIMKLKTP